MSEEADSLMPLGQSSQPSPKETKVIYHVDDEGTPYLMKIPKAPSEVTLADFKEQLNRPAAKFFFKSKDEEVGIVKEEVIEDSTVLPLYNGRIVSWIVTNDGSGSDVKSDKTGSGKMRRTPDYDDDDTTTMASGISGVPKARKPKKRHHGHRPKPRAIDSVSQYGDGDTSTEYGSNVWEESDMTSMASYSTMTSISTVAKGGKRRVFTKTRPPAMPRIYSSSTLAESTVSESLQIITVTLRMDHINFLGISIMGQSAEDGVGGIFVGSIMNGGAVAADGRIQAGDLILNVNDYDFSNLTNEEAVKVLRDVVQASGPVTITVARPTYEGLEEMPTFEPRNEPIQPMDPAMWLHQTQSHQQKPLQFHHGPSQLAHGRSPTSTTLTSDSGSQATSNSMPEADRDLVTKLTLATSINLVARAMAATNSGLERKDHKWLKMTIPNSFLGQLMCSVRCSLCVGKCTEEP